jgi:hypothetical protein
MFNKRTVTIIIFISSLLLLVGSVFAQGIIQGIDPNGHRKNISVDTNGQLKTVSGGSGGVVTISDGTASSGVTVATPTTDGITPTTVYDLSVLSVGQCIDPSSKLDRIKCGPNGGVQEEIIWPIISISSVSQCLSVTTSAQQYTLPSTTVAYLLTTRNAAVFLLEGSNPVATISTTIGSGHGIVLPADFTLGPVMLHGPKIGYMSDSSGGELCVVPQQ